MANVRPGHHAWARGAAPKAWGWGQAARSRAARGHARRELGEGVGGKGRYAAPFSMVSPTRTPLSRLNRTMSGGFIWGNRISLLGWALPCFFLHELSGWEQSCLAPPNSVFLGHPLPTFPSTPL